jgi:uncharacterized membrane protein YhaH (DUF805 family)
MTASLRPGEWAALAVALVWSLGLMLAATLLPSYEGTSETSSEGVNRHHSTTLVEENGSGVLLVVFAPLLATLVVALALWARRVRAGAGPIAWSATALLAGLTLLGMLTIGPMILPVTACLLVACAIHGNQST